MDTQQLQAFVAVAESASFSAAAAQLHLTQPAVSKRIALLEAQVETALFDRIGRKVALTAAGGLLLPRAKAVLNEVEAGYQALSDLRGEVKGVLSIGTSHHIGLHYLPAPLREFLETHPAVTLDLHFLDSEQAYAEVLKGRFDMALVTLAGTGDARLDSTQLWQDRLRFVAGHGHPLAARKTLTLRELSRHAAVMPGPGTYTTRLVSELFDRQELPLAIGKVTNHLDTVKMLVGIGQGWGVLPERLVDEQVKILPLKHRPILRPLGVIHHRQRFLPAAAQRFLAQLKG